MADTSDSLLSAPPLEAIRKQLQPSANASTHLSLSLSLATPMFGGGVTAGQVDPHQPFRPSAIRGQLRFWWRATAGAQYDTPEKLFQAEAAIWGDTRHASRVRLRVTKLDPKKNDNGKKDAEATDAGWEIVGKEPKRKQPAYVHFLIPDKVMKAEFAGAPTPQRRLLTGRFDLEIEWWGLDRQQADGVEMAVRAWLLFGGIGARTRRGCGTLSVEKIAGWDPTKPKESILQFFAQLPKTQTRPWPTLKGATLFLGPENCVQNPQRTWEQLIREYANFRQQRTPNRPAPGRSYWPEPEAIRELTGRRANRHKREKGFEDDPIEFPRALLGLPIITQFKDERLYDPGNTTLQARDAQNHPIRRHASPLILKALPLGPDRAISMALLLNTDIVKRLKDHLELLPDHGEAKPGLKTGTATSPLDIRATKRAERKNGQKLPMTLREWFRAAEMQEVIL